ncbi:MAG: hypothetical protein ACM3X7_11030 [Solirubrobacterales bacterium]
MSKDISELLNEYRNYTLEIIKLVKSDDLSRLEELVQFREDIVKEASNFTVDDEAKKVYKDFGLEELQKELNAMMEDKLNNIKSELELINKKKTLNGAYKHPDSVNAKIFNKKI